MSDPGAVTDPPTDVSAQEVVEALTAILDSETFAAAPRSRDFLAYIVTEHLAGRGDRLSEHAVARHALGRREYDARLNSAVRVQAVRLRAKLDRYYDGEGDAATVRFGLPTGSYAPVVERHEPGPLGAGAQDDVAVAVLQFGGTGDAAALIAATVCDAVAERLVGFPGLRVVGPTSVAPGGVEVAARRLGVRFVLDGAVTITDEAACLEAVLTDAATGDAVWRVDERLAPTELDAAHLEERWAAGIAAQIGDAAGVIFRRALAHDAGSSSAVYAARLAYHDYLLKATAESIGTAAEALDRALEEGRRAELLALRGSIHNAEVNQGASGRDREHELSCAERLGREALALEPDSPMAHLVLAGTAWQRQEWETARHHATRAAELGPWNPSVLMSAGTVMAVAGDWGGGVQTLRKGFRLNPVHPGFAHAIPALACLIAGDDAGALAEASLIHAPGQWWGPLYRALALAALGYQDQASVEMAQVLELEPGFLDDPAAHLTRGARFSDRELDTLLAHFKPFRGGQAS
jgi:tetratricopeptide (TPR) repeat protein